MIKFGIIGLGHIGKRHAEMITRNPETDLVAVMDILPAAQLDVHQSNIQFYTNLELFFNNHPELDVVSVACPNGLHAHYAMKVLKAGKHVLIEKPITLSSTDAIEIIDFAEKQNLKVFTVMQNRYSPPSKWLKEMVESNRLGKIYTIQINCFWNRDERYYTAGSWHGKKQLDGGTLFTQFSHFIDILIWCFGKPKIVRSKLFNFNHQNLIEFEDSGFVEFDINGSLGQLNYSTSIWNKNFESSILIIAENGTVKVGGQYMDKIEYCHVKDYAVPSLEPTQPGNDYGGYKGSAQNHHKVIQHLVDVLKGREEMDITAREGLAVVSTIEEIYAKAN